MQYGFTSTWLTQQPESGLAVVMGGPGWLATFAAYMGVWIMMMFTMDYAALGKREDTKFHQRWSFGGVVYILAYAFSALVGIFLTFTIPGLEAFETGIAGVGATWGPILTAVVASAVYGGLWKTTAGETAPVTALAGTK